MVENKFDVNLDSIKYSINGIEYEFNFGEEILFSDTGHNMIDVKGKLDKDPRGHFWVFKFIGVGGLTTVGVSKNLILKGVTTLKKIPVIIGGSRRRTKRRTRKTKQSRSMKKFRRK